MRREPKLESARVGWVLSSLEQAGLFEGSGELGHKDRLETSPIRELALRGLGAGAGIAVERGEQGVLGMRQAERDKRPINGSTQAGGEPPQEVADGGVLGRLRHTK